jgi:hypothetical protein
MIKTVIKFRNNMVMVLDKKGEQIPEYQGSYEKMKKEILQEAPPDTLFAHGFTEAGEPIRVQREKW